LGKISFFLRLVEVRCEIGEKTASYETSTGRLCGVDGREFRRKSAGSVDSIEESSGGSLGIGVLPSSSLQQYLFEINDDSLLLSIFCLKYLNI
jgi:hypothetical protein